MAEHEPRIFETATLEGERRWVLDCRCLDEQPFLGRYTSLEDAERGAEQHKAAHAG